MDTLELSAEARTVLGKRVRRLRREGIIPANLYGHGESRAIQAPARMLEHLLAKGATHSIVSVKLGNAENQTALIKAVTRDPVSGSLMHVELQAVSLDERVTTTITLRFVGEAPGVKLGGVLVHPLDQVRVEAVARALPEDIEVDLSPLESFGDSIKVSDLKVPDGVTLHEAADEVVVVVQAPKVEREGVEEAVVAEAVPAPAPAPAAKEAAEEAAPEEGS